MLTRTDVTVSPRIATGHSEPSLAKNCTVESLPGTNVTDDMFVLNAVAHNCRVWPGGFMNEDNTAQPMIYAFGSGTWTQLQSDSLNAPLGRHIRYGKFSMDLRQATGEGGVPSASQALSGVTLEGGLTKDSDAAKIAHAVLGCLAIFFLWPINVLLVGFFKRLQIHIGVSILIMVFLIIAYALGISMSSEYNRVRTFMPIFTLRALANHILVQELQFCPPNRRIHKHRSDPPPLPSPHSTHRRPLPLDPTPPHPAFHRNISLPDRNRRSRTAPRITAPPSNLGLFHRLGRHLLLHLLPRSLHTKTWLGVRTRNRQTETSRGRRTGPGAGGVPCQSEDGEREREWQCGESESPAA